MKKMCLLLVILLCPFVSWSQDQGFLEALKSFQDKDFPAAEKHYVTLLNEHPNDPVLITNLGLTEWELGKKGLALGYFNQALALDPSYAPAQKAMEFTQSHFTVENPSHETVLLESLHGFFKTISLWNLGFLHLLVFVGLFWSLLTLAKNQQNQKPLSSLLGLISLFGLLWILSLSLVALKFMDQMQARGIMIAPNTQALALPDEKSVSLLELKEGVDVRIEQQGKDWTQVHYPGAATGWVPSSSVYIYRKGL